MLIVIPTYRRNACLHWVLQSLVQCRTDTLDEPVRVLVVNNYPPAKDEIQNIVDRFSHDGRFSWQILFRDTTLPPVENWYSSILAHAQPDEVVMINADDDLFFPWSLEERYREIRRLDAELLLAELDSSLIFSQHAQRVCHLEHFPIPETARGTRLSLEDVYDYTPQHLSNHCYRNTQAFRDSLVKAQAWCHAQDWLDFHNRTLFITLYLPYAILLSGGRVVGLPQKCVIRGRDLEEVQAAKYGVPSWNHGFIHLCALGVLDNSELKEFSQLDSVRAKYSDEFVRWFLTCLFDARVGRKRLVETLDRVHFPLARLASLKALHGANLVVRDLLRLRAWRLARASARHSVPMDQFMNRLATLAQP